MTRFKDEDYNTLVLTFDKNSDIVTFENDIKEAEELGLKYLFRVFVTYGRNTPPNYENKMDDLHITEAIMDVMNLLNRANKYIEETAPWTLAKDESKINELKAVMSHLTYIIYNASILLKPVLVNKAKESILALGVKENEIDYDNLKKPHLLDNNKVTKINQLFPRLNADDVDFVKSLMVQK